MKNREDQNACEEELDKKGKVNPDFINKNNLTEKSYPEDQLKYFLPNEQSRTCEHETGLHTS